MSPVPRPLWPLDAESGGFVLLIMPIFCGLMQPMPPILKPWSEFRQQMPVTRQLAYLDHAAVAPLSGPAGEAIGEWAEQAVERGDTVWPQWARRVEQVRAVAAQLIGADADEIAFVPNTTTGISLVAEGFPWRSGDNVVTLANEFPSNQFPWMNLQVHGVQTRRLPVESGRVDLARILDACDDRTRIVSVSWVGYASGWRVDVESLARAAHKRGIYLFLDAIQGLGVFPLDVRRSGVDFLAADGHKWMLGPEGAGLLYVRREHLDLLRPLNVGWNSVVDAHDFSRCELDLRPTAARYEGGSANMAGIAALGASLDLLASFGLSPAASPIAERVVQLVDQAAARLKEIGAVIRSPQEHDHSSGILSFELPGADSSAVRQRCLSQGVVLSVRHGWLRISPHAYNDQQDLERLVDALAAGR